MPLVTMASEPDRREFMRNFIGCLGNTEFGKVDFEDFLFESGYVKGEAGRLLLDLYNGGLIEKQAKTHGANTTFSYRIPDDVKGLVEI